jgi:hypothetical protein
MLSYLERMRTQLRALMLIVAAFPGLLMAVVQAPRDSQLVDVGIMVLATEKDVSTALERLPAGADIAVMAKELSIDPTANDGGSMGLLIRRSFDLSSAACFKHCMRASIPPLFTSPPDSRC